MAKDKKAQAARREGRRIMQQFEKEVMGKIEHFNVSLRARPRWVPRAAWRWCMNLFVDVDRLENMVMHTPSIDGSTK